MRILVGVDAQSVDEVEASLSRFGGRYTSKLFTEHEIGCCDGDANPARGFAARFAAKEAVIKILGSNGSVPLWKSIEVRCSMGRRPSIELLDDASMIASRQNLGHLRLSLGVEESVAMAVVITQVNDGGKLSG
jgi:holo-[acyl-carrier protein] synthase